MNTKWKIMKMEDETWTLFIFNHRREWYPVAEKLNTVNDAYLYIGEPKEGEIYEIEVVNLRFSD